MSRANISKRGREAPDTMSIQKLGMRKVRTYRFTSGFRAVLHDEAKDRDGMGWDGIRWGYQKYHSMFFILREYMHVHIYLHIFSKIFTNSLMGFKI